MKKICVFDIEATDWVNFACLGFFDGYQYKVFWSLEEFADFYLTAKYRGYTCFAHFGGKYDFRFLIPVLMASGKYTIKFLERGSHILSMTVRDTKSKCSWKFSDSYFLLPASLKDLGKNFNITYLKKDFDVEGEKDFKSAEAQDYLRHDCFGLYEILEKFSTWGLNRGDLKMTLPSQSLHIFTKNYLKTKLVPLTEEQETFIRKTYFGGRVEIFKMYGENLNYYDFNSLYPTVMLEQMPVGLPVRTLQYHADKIGFYRVQAIIPDTIIPPLPTVLNKKLFFPSGEGEFYTTSAELELLKSIGGSFKVLEGVVFTHKRAIFSGYIKEMYDLRMKSQKGTIDNFLAKLLMNSLYGKFGQRRDNKELIFSFTPINNSTPLEEELGLYIIDKESRGKYILPYLASYITSLARVRLYNKMLEAGLNNVWYCDTDSIITSSKLKTGNNLGDLKHEYTIKRGVFLQPKAYAMETDIGDFIKVKGMREIKLSVDDFVSVLKDNDVTKIKSRYKTIMGFRDSIKRYKNVTLKRHEVIKKLNNLYDKRQIIGVNTFPFNYKYLVDKYKPV